MCGITTRIGITRLSTSLGQTQNSDRYGLERNECHDCASPAKDFVSRWFPYHIDGTATDTNIRPPARKSYANGSEHRESPKKSAPPSHSSVWWKLRLKLIVMRTSESRHRFNAFQLWAFPPSYFVWLGFRSMREMSGQLLYESHSTFRFRATTVKISETF